MYSDMIMDTVSDTVKYYDEGQSQDLFWGWVHAWRAPINATGQPPWMVGSMYSIKFGEEAVHVYTREYGKIDDV